MEFENKIVVTYGDTTLHQSDVDLLEGDNWVNDNIIAFYFEWLTNERFKEFKEIILFMDPSTIFLTENSEDPEELKTCLVALNLDTKARVFMPINNHTTTETAGGTHWALLVYEREHDRFVYYDSYYSEIIEAARLAAFKIYPLLGVEDYKEGNVPKITLGECPKQINGYDCGLYVASFAELLLAAFLGEQTKTLKQSVTPATIASKRKEIKELVLKLQYAKSKTGIFSLKKQKKNQLE